MRTARRLIEFGLPVAGNILVFSAILLARDNPPVQVVVVLAGLLMLQAGIWKLTQPLLPDERRFRPLRQEVDAFIDLVRQLNQEALRNADARRVTSEHFEDVHARMIESANRMADVAGRLDTDRLAGTAP
jgi:hypothetical protein